MDLIDNEAQARSTTQQRLKILGDDEIDELYARPRFTSDERIQFFSLSQPEKDLLQELRSVKSQVLFVLQLGYFKAKHLFFSFDFDEVDDDAQYVCEQHFNASDFDGLSALEKRTRLRQQRLILELFKYRNCNDEEREKLNTKAQQSAVVSGKPIYIFRELKHYLEEHRIVAPPYSFMQATVGAAITLEQTRLGKIVRETVEAVAALLKEKPAVRDERATVTVMEVSKQLCLDKSATSRRIGTACRAGYLENLESGKGRPLRLVLGEPLPEQRELLPPPQRLEKHNDEEVPF